MCAHTVWIEGVRQASARSGPVYFCWLVARDMSMFSHVCKWLSWTKLQGVHCQAPSMFALTMYSVPSRAGHRLHDKQATASPAATDTLASWWTMSMRSAQSSRRCAKRRAIRWLVCIPFSLAWAGAGEGNARRADGGGMVHTWDRASCSHEMMPRGFLFPPLLPVACLRCLTSARNWVHPTHGTGHAVRMK